MNELEKILEILRQYQREMGARYGIERLGLFGSVARGEDRETSDLDVVIELSRPNLFLLSRIRLELEERVRRPVDLVRYRDRMNSFLRRRIDEEARYA